MISIFLGTLSLPPPQDHLLLPASALLLQHLAVGLCSPSEAAGAATHDHLGHPPAGDLPEAAVGEPAAARAPGQPVSKHTRCLLKMQPQARGLCQDILSAEAVGQISSSMVIGWCGSSLHPSRGGCSEGVIYCNQLYVLLIQVISSQY